MFIYSKFNGDSNNCNFYNCLYWDISNVKNIKNIFRNSPLEKKATHKLC